ncbi:MAG: YraN family protein [Pseudomonadota bacterium]
MNQGQQSYHTGLAAEDIALRSYLSEGATLLAQRWRCPEGEIDLIVRLRGESEIVFVEVKARRTRDAAAAAPQPAQWHRIGQAAMRFLGERGLDHLPCRFDLVVVDRMGRANRIENAATFDGW